MHGLNIYADNELLAHVDLNRVDSPYNFTLSLPQSETEILLQKHLETLGGTIEFQTTCSHLDPSEGKYKATLKKNAHEEEAHFKYIIGCDGAHSKIRHELKIPFEGLPYPQNFIQADFILETEDIEPNEGYAFLQPDSIFSILPLGKKYSRCIASVEKPIPAEQLNLEFFENLIYQRTPINVTSIHSPTWFNSFRIHRRKVPTMSQNGAFLAGDAAHIHSPIAGQGMNGGIQDAYNLGWKLAYTLKGYCPESLLNSYSLERSPVADHILHRTHQLTSLLSSKNRLFQEIRNTLVPILGQFDYVQNRFVNFIEEIKINYRKSPIVQKLPRWERIEPLPGDRAPDTHILASQGITHIRLYEKLKSTSFTLLIFSSNKRIQETNKLLHFINENYADIIDPIIISEEISNELDISQENLFRDPSKSSFDAYNVKKHAIFLIRPDNYIAFRKDRLKAKPLRHYLEKFFPR